MSLGTQLAPTTQPNRGARPSGRLFDSPWAAIVAVSSWWLISLAAAWPGWMSPDSGDQWRAAVSGDYDDWHPVAPSLAWHFLKPESLGPKGPVVLQFTSFAIGFLLAMLWAQRRSARAAWIAFSLLVFSPLPWHLAWILSDGWILGSLSLATGLLLITSDAVGASAHWLALASGAAFGVCALARPYIVPVLALWIVALILMTWSRDRRERLAVMVLLAAVAALATGTLATRTVHPTHRYSWGSTMLLDLARTECAYRTPQAVMPAEGAIPREFILGADAGDLCSVFRSNVWNPMIWNEIPTKLRLPATAAESRQLIRAWVSNILQNPNMVLAGKIEAFTLLATNPADEAMMPQITGSRLKPGGITNNMAQQSPATRFQSNGGTPLAVAAMPISLVDALAPSLTSGMVLILVFPVAALARVVRHSPSRSTRVRAAILAVTPTAYLAVFALMTPATDTRYASPAQLMGLLAGTVLLCSAPSSGRVESTTTSPARDSAAESTDVLTDRTSGPKPEPQDGIEAAREPRGLSRPTPV